MPQFSPRPTGGRKRKVDRPTEIVLIPPPRDLSKAHRDVWRKLAPAACALGTLTAETVSGFALLVATVAARDQAAQVINTQGLIVEGAAHPLLTHFRQLGQRAESLMAKFCLTALGRPVQRPAAKPPSKWDGILSRRDASPHDFYGDRPPSPRPRRPRRARPRPPADALEAVAKAHEAGTASEEDLLNEILKVQ